MKIKKNKAYYRNKKWKVKLKKKYKSNFCFKNIFFKIREEKEEDAKEFLEDILGDDDEN